MPGDQMKAGPNGNAGHMALLAKLMFQGYDSDFSSAPNVERLSSELEQVSKLSEPEFRGLLELADKHHVTIRALRVLEVLAAGARQNLLEEWCGIAIESESKRISNAIEWLHAIVEMLQNSRCPVSVIKSLDHWPDLGSDLDLYTSGSPEQVCHVMRDKS